MAIRKTLMSVVAGCFIFTGCGSTNEDLSLDNSDTEEAKADKAPVVADPADDQFIQKLAEECGEYFTPPEEYKDNIKPVALKKLPRTIRKIAKNLLTDRKGSTVGYNDPYIDDCFFIQNDDGKTIGYIIPIEDAINDSLWDGSGVNYFLNIVGETVDSVEWSG